MGGCVCAWNVLLRILVGYLAVYVKCTRGAAERAPLGLRMYLQAMGCRQASGYSCWACSCVYFQTSGDFFFFFFEPYGRAEKAAGHN